jgi:thymidylate synthase
MTAQQAWIDTLKRLLDNPSTQDIHGALGPTQTSHEILSHCMVFNMAENCDIIVPDRNIKTYAQHETAMILNGSNRLTYTETIQATLSKWSDDKMFIRSAYGPRFVDQLPYLLETFRHDLFSRRAVINIWRDSPGQSKDTSCLLSLQFIVRDNKLNCIATMRSSDAWLGLPNDTIVFCYISEYIVDIVNSYLGVHLTLGHLYNTAGSRHIYTKDIIKVGNYLDAQNQ